MPRSAKRGDLKNEKIHSYGGREGGREGAKEKGRGRAKEERREGLREAGGGRKRKLMQVADVLFRV